MKNLVAFIWVALFIALVAPAFVSCSSSVDYMIEDSVDGSRNHGTPEIAGRGSYHHTGDTATYSVLTDSAKANYVGTR